MEAKTGNSAEFLKRLRIGEGSDIHRLVEGRKLILGGVEIPHSHGLDGHSDADVLSHAIVDALLGAIGKQDIGHHFSPMDPRWSGVSSILFLKEARSMAAKAGFWIINIDSTIIAEQPRLGTFIDAMRHNIADALGIADEAISVKVKTSEGIGFVGRNEGMEAHAVALLAMAKTMD